MNKKTVFSFLLVIILAFGLMWWSGRSQASLSGKEAVSAGQLEVSEKVYDFGSISMAAGNVTKVFTVSNNSGEDINVKTVSTSCMCTKAFIEGGAEEKGPFGMAGMGYLPPADELIRAGETREIKVVYDPAAHGPAGVGPIDRFVYLEDDRGGVTTLEIKAKVTP